MAWKIIKKLNETKNTTPVHPLEGLTIVEIEEMLNIIQMDNPKFKDFKYLLKFKASNGDVHWWYELLGKK